MKYTFNAPWYVVWCITGACNLNCLHCSTNARKKLPNELSTDEAINVIEQLANLGIFQLGFSGGEPLLRKDIFELIEIATDKGILVGIGTNGLIFTPDIAKELRDLGIDHVQVSLDGATPETHEKQRGVPNIFQKAINAIKICVREEVKVHTCFTSTRINFKELENVIDLCAQLGVNRFNWSRFVPLGRGTKSLDLTSREWKDQTEIFMKKRDQYEIIERMEFITHTSQIVLHDPSLMKQNLFQGCVAGITKIAIWQDGSVSPCAVFDMRIGNVRETSLAEIWRKSSELIKLRDRSNLKGKCRDCKFVEFCGGCRGVAYHYTGDYLAEDPRCWIELMNGEPNEP